MVGFQNLQAVGVMEKVRLVSMAPSDFGSVVTALTRSEPAEVYYLAGQSSVGLSFEQPVQTLESISLGVLNLVEAIRLLGKPISRQAQNAIIPRVNSREFRADAQYKVAIDKLRALTIPIVLIHIPTSAELRNGSAALTHEQEEIWRILEVDLKTRIHTIFDRRTSVAIPEKIDLAPWEGHPNHDGIRFYGRYVADLLISHVKR